MSNVWACRAQVHLSKLGLDFARFDMMRCAVDILTEQIALTVVEKSQQLDNEDETLP